MNLWVSIPVVLGFAREIVPSVTTLAFDDGFLGSGGMIPETPLCACTL